MEVWRIGQLNEHMGDLVLSDLLDGWRTFQLERCAKLKPATVERFRATLQAALNSAGRLHGISVPRMPKISFRNEIVRYLTVEERDRLLNAYPAHVKPIMLTLCFQGCRTQEALQLQWEHVDLERRTMFFPRTKSGHPRTIKMHMRVFEAITGLFEARDKPNTGQVFLNRMGEPYSDTRDYKLPGGNPLRSAHATACKKAAIENFRVHDWRHHFACWCVMSGVDLETLKRLGGWRTLRMLERYMAVSTEHMDRAIELVA
ncbi:MAG: tyrosine-type recombinase/integrase [Methylocystis sp.]